MNKAKKKRNGGRVHKKESYCCMCVTNARESEKKSAPSPLAESLLRTKLIIYSYIAIFLLSAHANEFSLMVCEGCNQHRSTQARALARTHAPAAEKDQNTTYRYDE